MPATSILYCRLPREDKKRLAREAARRRVTESLLARILIGDGLDRLERGELLQLRLELATPELGSAETAPAAG